ncbi:MAG: family 20 glycosylhydrolase [Cytophagales bacterium]|nr:family 20 glycosylhydrolase [Cytophagales bacterium]
MKAWILSDDRTGYGVRLALSVLILGTMLSCDHPNKDEPEHKDQTVSIVPYPRSVSVKKGSLALDENLIINVHDEAFLPFAEVFSANIFALTGKKARIRIGERTGSGIILKINPALDERQHRISITGSARIEAGAAKSLVNGCYSFLQLIERKGAQSTVPKLEIADRPDSRYRGLMIDLARNWHDVKTVLKLIDLAAFYKINYVQLHFTDYQSYTLPSNCLPKLSTQNRHYSFDELKLFEEYARLRGISIVPELDIPGHAKAMIDAYPELFGIKDIVENPYTINMGKEEVYEALECLINELIDIYGSSPYFHIGGDEAIFHLLDQDPDVKSYMAGNQLGEDIHELYRHFIVRMNEIVKLRGKQLCVWEGFRKNGEVDIPKDILVFEYETAFYLPCELINDGYKVVNASWKPLYVVNEKKWSPEYIYGWNMWRWENWFHKVPSFNPIQCEQSPNVIGGQMCAWEQAQELEFPSLRRRLAAFSERVWRPGSPKPLSDFLQRMEKTDNTLSKLVDDSRQDTLEAFDK